MVEGYIRCLVASKSLFTKQYKGAIADAWAINSRRPIEPPLNTEAEILADFATVLCATRSSLGPVNYWNGEMYDPFDVLVTCIEFLDRHDLDLPKTTLPPSEDVEAYVQAVLNSSSKLRIVDQLKLGLNIANNDLLGAVNLAFLATRILARGSDTRAYPDIEITPDTIVEANNHLAQFEKYNCLSETGDALADTYYFWTHLFAGLAYSQLNCANSHIFDSVFSVGTPVMVFVRKYFAGQATMSEYREASILGRAMGLTVGEIVRSQ